jgi:folate-binding protein YgfZ
MTLQRDYGTIQEGAAIGAVSPRHQLAVAGSDRASFLQGLLTNDIPSLVAGSGCYAAWLSPQGRMLTDMHVLESGTMMLLDLPQETASATLARLEQFLFSEDVQLASLAETLTGLWLHGPRAAAVLESVLDGAADLTGWRDYQHAPLTMAGAPVSVARIDQLGVPGFCLYVERSREEASFAALESAGAARVAAEAIAAARVEAGYPVFGVDMTEDTIPLEAGIENRAISFTKGCYVGQEIIIRVLHRGGGRVARKLVGLRIEKGPAAASVPATAAREAGHGPGTKVYSGEREIGHVTSVAESPRLGSIALAYVHRDFAAPGTTVDVQDGALRARAVVAERPMRET